MHTSHFSLAGLVFLAVIAVVQFSPTQVAMAQCGGLNGFTGFSGPQQIGFSSSGQPEYQGYSGVRWDPIQHDPNNIKFNQETPDTLFGFLLPENVFAQCGSTPPSTEPSVSLTATPGSVTSGGTSVLSWTGANVTSCTGVGFSTGGATSGSVNVTPGNTTEYTINCSANAESSYTPPEGYEAAGCGEITVPVGMNCMAGEPVYDDCSATERAYYQTELRSRECGEYGYRTPPMQWGFCREDSSCVSGSGQTVSDSATVTVNACTAAYNSSQWYTGGTQVGVSPREGGNHPYDCDMISPGGITYTHWNRHVRSQQGGPSEHDPIQTSCYYYNNSTGTTYKPPNEEGNPYNPQSPSYANFYDSGTVCTTPDVPQCSDGIDNDRDTLIDLADGGCSEWTDDDEVGETLPECSDGRDNNGAGGQDYPNDPSCSSADDTTEDGVTAGVSCAVDTASVATGGTTTYRATVSNGANAPFTWTTSGQTLCTGGQNNTCTFPATGPYTMSVRAQGATNPASCPIVTAGCAGPSELSLTANGEEEDVRVKEGGVAVIAWEITGTSATSCTVTENGVVVATPTPNACNVSGDISRTITTQTTYLLTCGGDTELVIVNVGTNLQEF